MNTVELQAWSQIEEAVNGLPLPAKLLPGAAAPRFLFRGQSNADWRLRTTLERRGAGETSLEAHYRLIFRISPQIETFTDRTWSIPTPPEFREWLDKHDTLMPVGYPAYDYMVYLRHHGFPSPLLDWSRSLYIAAYFAFADSTAAERVAIFAYVERPTGMKGYSSASPAIWGMGPNVRSHRRHFVQQSEYTICIVRNDSWRYASHEDAFGRDRQDQDLLWKFTLPSSERVDVLRRLDAFNINAFSLFGSEEALMDTLAQRAYELSSASEPAL